MNNILLLEELYGIFGEDLTDVAPEEIFQFYDRDSRDTLRIALPTVAAEALECRSYDEHRSVSQILLIALIRYLQNPAEVRPRPKS
jgi:hypothetical protein